ncbi:MAG: glycosyltransferase family 2 protein [Bacteroidota bacterium]
MDKEITPLLSVVFTSYNHEKYLQQAVEAILNQTFKDFELIIVDDASTDSSAEILKRYSKIDYVKLHLLAENTGSYVKASNYGAQGARGRYLIFAQCDDYAELTQFDTLIKALENDENVGVAFCRSNLIDEDSNFISDDYTIRDRVFKRRFKKDTKLSSAEVSYFLSYSCILPNLSAAILRTELYKRVLLSEKYLMAADWLFWLDLSKITNFYYISKPLNNFRQHSATIRSKTKIDKQLKEIYAVFNEHISKYNLKGRSKNDLLTGFGNVWCNYFLEAPLPVASSLIRSLYKYTLDNKMMPYFLIKGTLKKVSAIILK